MFKQVGEFMKEEKRTKLEKQEKPSLSELESLRTKTEVYSRIVGYVRPISEWNDAKQAEFKDRKEFNVGVRAVQG